MGELIAGAKKPTLFCMEGAAVWTFFQTQARSSDGTLGIVQAATIRKRSGHAFEACWRAFRAQQGDEQQSKRSSSLLMKALESIMRFHRYHDERQLFYMASNRVRIT